MIDGQQVPHIEPGRGDLAVHKEGIGRTWSRDAASWVSME